MAKEATALRVIAPVYPRISNHNDLDPLRFHPEVDFRFVGPNDSPPPCDLIVLPGSKAVQADLEWLRAQGWEELIRRHLRYGGKLIGICGGLQMLGRQLHDPLGLEGPPGSRPGLAWLDYETRLAAEKTLQNVSGELLLPGAASVSGYRIHMGVTQGAALATPALRLAGQPDGALSSDGQILATYCHGLFDSPAALAALLTWAGHRPRQDFDAQQRREADIDRLADAAGIVEVRRYVLQQGNFGGVVRLEVITVRASVHHQALVAVPETRKCADVSGVQVGRRGQIPQEDLIVTEAGQRAGQRSSRTHIDDGNVVTGGGQVGGHLRVAGVIELCDQDVGSVGLRRKAKQGERQQGFFHGWLLQVDYFVTGRMG